MKLTIVVPVLGQHALADEMVRNLLSNIRDSETEIVAIDNGGDYNPTVADPRFLIHRPGKNLGVYPVFDYAFKFEYVKGDIVAFFHSDLIVVEQGFDLHIINYFVGMPKLGLMGFVGSNEIDFNGGRGGGTTSNFQGGTYRNSISVVDGQQQWQGSPAEAHGMRNGGFTDAAVVDGCAMVIRREAWEKIGFRADFPLHHFYDRLISTQMIEAGYKVGVLGVACDHISGQTVSKESRYADMAKEWCIANGVAATHNYDDAIYREAEKRWLYEFRQVKNIIPIKV